MTRKKQRLKKIKLCSVLLYETRYDEKFRFPKRKKERRKTDIRHATNNIVRFIDQINGKLKKQLKQCFADKARASDEAHIQIISFSSRAHNKSPTTAA